MKQHEKVLIILANAKGKPVTVTELQSMESASGYEFYRMSTYMWKLRKMGAEVKVNKNGKNVVSYELTNHDKFTNYSPAVKVKAAKPAVKAKKAKAAKKAPAAKPAKAAKQTKAPTPVETPVVNDGSVAFAVDESFDSHDDINADNISDLAAVG